MFGYIYKTTNKVNNKIYIGQHLSPTFLGTGYLGSGSLLRKSVKKYGKENFRVELLKECNSQEELDYWERHFIAEYDSRNLKVGYNITEGGWGGVGPRSEDTKRKISEYNKGKVLVNNGKSCFKIPKELFPEYQKLGYKLGAPPFTRSDEFKEKVRNTNKGKIAVHMGSVRTWVREEELEAYIASGYTRGFLDEDKKKRHIWTSVKGTGRYRYIFKDGEYLKVAESELSPYLLDGWVFKGPPKNKKRIGNKGYKPTQETIEKLRKSHIGKKQSKESIEKSRSKIRGKKFVHKNYLSKLVSVEEIQKYLENGWKLHRCPNKLRKEYQASILKEYKDLESKGMSAEEAFVALVANHEESTMESIRDMLSVE